MHFRMQTVIVDLTFEITLRINSRTFLALLPGFISPKFGVL